MSQILNSQLFCCKITKKASHLSTVCCRNTDNVTDRAACHRFWLCLCVPTNICDWRPSLRVSRLSLSPRLSHSRQRL